MLWPWFEDDHFFCSSRGFNSFLRLLFFLASPPRNFCEERGETMQRPGDRAQVPRLRELARKTLQIFFRPRLANRFSPLQFVTLPSSPRSVPPIRAKIVREWSYFLAGKSYNVTCQIKGSNPSAYTKVKIGTAELKINDFQVRDSGYSFSLGPW